MFTVSLRDEAISEKSNKSFEMSFRRSKRMLGISPENLMVEIAYIMDALKVTDAPRVIQILRTSVDPVAFVTKIRDLTGKTTDEILAVLDNIAYFKPIAANYRLRTAESFDAREFETTRVDVRVSSDEYSVIGEQKDLIGQPISDYLKLMRETVSSIPFIFRDEMQRYVNRFLGKELPEGIEKSNPDLLDIVESLTGFLSGIDLGKIRYVITSGIGANEMYSHQLAKVINEFFRTSRIDCRWIVVNNPAHLEIIPQDANNENTIIFEMSRSGTTKETVDFFNATKDRFKKRIVAANGKALYEAGVKLKDEKDSHILLISNTPDDIGGRQMNRKTLMVYAPLFVALTAGLKSTEEAQEYLKYYCQALTDANEELTYSKGLKSTGVNLAEFLFRHRESGRNKFSVIYDESLKFTQKELFQLLNEGANKNIAGSTNNNFLDAYSLTADEDIYREVFSFDPDSQLPIFLLNKNSRHYKQALSYIKELETRGIPCIVISVELSDNLELNLKALARTSALLQDMVVYFTYITNQDANSNPAVKLVREITKYMFEILKDKKEKGTVDTRIIFEDVIDKITQEQSQALAKVKEDLDKRGIKRVDIKAIQTPDSPFREVITDLKLLSNRIGLPETVVTEVLIEAISKSVVKTDAGEAGNRGTQEVEVAFARSDLDLRLGILTPEVKITPLDEQIVLQDKDGIRISIAVEKGKADTFRGSESIEKKLASYLYSMYQARKDGLMYISLIYMSVDSENPKIRELRKMIIDEFKDKDITVPILALPDESHKGIEAIMSHPKSVFNIAIIYTNTYSGDLGKLAIDKFTTIDEATYVYGISNAIRMALGGTPSIIFEVRNSKDLEYIKAVLRKSLYILRKKY